MRQLFWGCAIASILTFPAQADFLPPESPQNQSVVGIVSDDGQLSTFYDLLAVADLTGELSKDGPYTVFAPTNEAFEKHLYGVTVEDLKKLENRKKLQAILAYHVVPARITTADIDGNKIFETQDRVSLNIMPQKDSIRVNQAKVIGEEVIARNGVVHPIDGVLIPANAERF
jgi:uncharacterized surface protein with fasciclin (FAS1) repeats